MAGVAGNNFTLSIGRQTAKGTPQTSPTYKLKLTGGDLAPQREILTLAETDSSRQEGKNVVVAARVEGAPEMYVRPDDFGLLAYGLLGTNADAGTAPNYIHTATMLNSGNVPYFTVYKTIGNTVLVDRYEDCRITGLNVRGQAGQAITTTVNIAGISATFGETEPVLSAVTQAPLVFPQVTVSKGGAAPCTVESFEINMQNNPTILQADCGITPYDIVPGKLQVNGTMTLLFENDEDYRSFHTGSSSGTEFSTDLFTESLAFAMVVTALLRIDFSFASVAYTAYPVPPDAAGAPIRVAVGWQSQPDPTVANYATVETRNTVASY